MSDQAKKLQGLGAEFVGGFAYLDRKEVGRWSGGQFVCTAEGEARLAAAEEVVADAPALTPAPEAPKKSAKKVKPTEAPAPTEDVGLDLDSLLGEIE